uniref:GHMP kinase C-terminal domain-containing protein n=2 Tax=Paramoeba aestuarina TaxID=180227 RepID=A0A7S4KMP5_9EUKA|mmetsp:Transcript_21426/g.33291  ORF Transcript_21426/g.33291 Transcript_21426/m.33291 type:complete len:130 (+) Transcript_21426:131-520(+)
MTEQARVFEGKDEWRKGDFSSFGRLVFASGESSVNNYEAGSPQLVTLYELFCEIGQTGGVYGARFSGGGFGGCCLALVDPQQQDAIAKRLHAIYPKKHPEEKDCYSIHFCDSAESVRLLGEDESQNVGL